MSDDKKPKITFAPSFFETFEGTQEELDELIAQVTQVLEEKIASGEYADIERTIVGEKSNIDWDELDEQVAKLSDQYGVDDNGFIKFPFPTIH